MRHYSRLSSTRKYARFLFFKHVQTNCQMLYKSHFANYYFLNVYSYSYKSLCERGTPPGHRWVGNLSFISYITIYFFFICHRIDVAISNFTDENVHNTFIVHYVVRYM